MPRFVRLIRRLGGTRGGEGAARVVEAWMEGETGTREGAFAQGTRCTFRARVRFERDVEDPDFAVAFVNAQRENARLVSGM